MQTLAKPLSAEIMRISKVDVTIWLFYLSQLFPKLFKPKQHYNVFIVWFSNKILVSLLKTTF